MDGQIPVAAVADAAIALWIALAEKLVTKGHLTRTEVAAVCIGALGDLTTKPTREAALATQPTRDTAAAARDLIREAVLTRFRSGR